MKTSMKKKSIIYHVKKPGLPLWRPIYLQHRLSTEKTELIDVWLSIQKLEPLWHLHLAQQVSRIMLLPDMFVMLSVTFLSYPFHYTITTNITWAGLTSWVVHARGPANVRSFPLTFSLRKAISVSLAISCYSPWGTCYIILCATRRKWTTSTLFNFTCVSM